MNVAVIGTDHTIADICSRERINSAFMEFFHEHSRQIPLILLQTCNRIELYFSAENIRQMLKILKKNLYERVPDLIDTIIYSFTLFDCFTHLIEVTTGLKSALFAETAIQGQIRRCYEEARKRPLSPELHFLFQKSLKVAKNIRSSSYFCEQTRYIEQLTFRKVSDFLKHDISSPLLFVGASTLNTSIARYFSTKGYKQILLCNRSEKAPIEYATLVPWDQLTLHSKKAQVIIAATTCPNIIIDEKMIGTTTRKLLLDLSMPRNIAPELKQFHDLVNIDMLSQGNAALIQPYVYDHTRQLIREAVTKQTSLFLTKKTTSISKDVI